MEYPIKVLLIEDSQDDAILLIRELKHGGYDPYYQQVDSLESLNTALSSEEWDIAISDYNIAPGFNGLKALELINEKEIDLPFIVVSGQIGENVAVEAMKSGANDYLMKDNLSRLIPAIKRELREAEVRRERKQAEIQLRNSFEKVQKMTESTIQAMSRIVELRDPYTAGHQQRVAVLSVAIARELGLPDDQIDGIRYAAVLHDVGKISVPSELLSKPYQLNQLEFNLLKTHPEQGFKILESIDFPWPVAKIVHQHHERLDGSGYPQGLQGDQILMEARILIVADVVEAMASHRPYRAALGIDKALEEITANRDKLYDPVVVDACIRLFKEKQFTFEDIPEMPGR